MATQRQEITQPTELVAALNLAAGSRYSIQVLTADPVSYSESADTENAMPEARHILMPLTIYTVEVDANTKIWVAPVQEKGAVVVTEGL